MKRSINGFTIVELLIVIVVIAILATISFVSYRGIQAKAAEAVIKSDLRNASMKLSMYRLDHGSFPGDEDELPKSDGIQFEYDLVDESYCLTATSDRSGASAFHTSPAGGIQDGACDGHSDGSGGGPVIANYMSNPGIETSTDSIVSTGASSIARDTARAHTGSASLRVTMGAGSWASQGTRLAYFGPFQNTLKPNTAYTASAYVYVPTGTTNIQISVQGTGRASAGSNPGTNTSVKGQWVRIHNVFTTAESGTIILYLLNYGVNDNAGMQFWADSIMIAEGDQLHDYAD